MCYVCGNVKETTPCMSEYCQELRARPEPSLPVFLSVSGGATNNVDWYRDREKGLEEYAEARKSGLQPPSTRKGSKFDAERDIESQQRAVNKLSQDNDISQLKVREHVDKP